ncbi:prolyl oligopeptidase family serine peptidase [Erythrobacteraceae bacterium WH01K]|nr:prolyl oligopeptidase family serine peptidase [Erythrobacteraceae bacterium WH01K]
MQTDLSDGLKALADAGIGDPDRACIVGASYGGYAALAGVTLQQGIYRCAVSVNGVSDLNDMFGSTLTGLEDVFSRNAERMLGSDPDLKALSPRHRAAKTDAPVLLVHGRDDTVVRFRQSVLMQDALKDAGKDVTLVALDGEDHWLSAEETRKAMLTATVAFVERHNPAE